MKDHMAFVAYTNEDPEVGKMVFTAVRRANGVDKCPTQYEPWEFNDISGKALVSPILSNIDKSHFIVADITLLNMNVVYEIGFAIGRKKKVLLIRHHQTEGDARLAKEVGIFDTLGYSSYSDEDGLSSKLLSEIQMEPIQFESDLDRKAPIYLLTGDHQSEASTMMVARIKKAKFRFRSFSQLEDVRLSATDAIRQVAKSAGVAIMLSGTKAQRVRSMFVAGLADGMGKPRLILSLHGDDVPLDIKDSVETVKHPNDISDFVAEFCPDVTAFLQTAATERQAVSNLLQHIFVGDPTAENEMTTLADYYLKTDQYLRTARGEVNLVVGRKGSGKTALFLQLRDSVRADKRNIVVDLKPESYQLLKLKDDILSLLKVGSKQHLITAFWEYLILLEVAYKLLEKDKTTHRFNHVIHDLYEKLYAAYHVDDYSTEGDFSERLFRLSDKLRAAYGAAYGNDSDKQSIASSDLTRVLYTHDLKSLKDIIADYLSHKGNVLVLFDNLDKSWSTLGVDDTDTLTLRCLIEAGRKVERDMQRKGLSFRCILFVRNDVYQHLMESSSDYGKEMRVTLDWVDQDLLREMMRLRLVSGADEKTEHRTFSGIWASIADSHVMGEESFQFIIDRSLMRPRNVIKLFNHSRAFAANFNSDKIEARNFIKGLVAYSQDILIELDRELRDVYPDAGDLLYYFMEKPSALDWHELNDILIESGLKEDVHQEIISFLLYHGIIGINVDGVDKYIFDYGYDMKKMTIRISRSNGGMRYCFNPAFIPALDVKDETHERMLDYLDQEP